MSTSPVTLLPDGQDVPFSQIEAALARLVRGGERANRRPARALLATIVVIGAPDRLPPAARALEQLSEMGGVRAILISEGDEPSPTARVTENTIAIAGLAPRFLDNAVAALRLSSLPALVWWRGGTVETLGDLAHLADRLVLDAADPSQAWRRAAMLLARTAVTDLRWAKLTRWRAPLAHLFDLPHVAAAAGSFTHLSIESADPYAARLYAGWLASSLGWDSRVRIDRLTLDAPSESPLQAVRLEGPDVRIALSLKPSGRCVEAIVDGPVRTVRAVPIGNGGLAALIGEELGVRTRDLAFERALARAREMTA